MHFKISKPILIIIYICSTLAVILLSIIWFSDVFTEDQWYEAYIFQDVITIVAASLAFLFFTYLTILYRFSTSTGKVWLFFAIGMLSWTIGEIIYCYLELFTDIEPFPSIADFFYLIAYIPLSIGLIFQARLIKITLSRQEKQIIAIVFTILTAIIFIIVILLPILDAFPIPENERLIFVLGALYPLGDLVLILCVLFVFAKLRHGTINIAWALILTGFLIDTIGDILFTWMVTITREELLFEPFDLLFIIGYILYINGALTMVYLMTNSFEKS